MNSNRFCELWVLLKEWSAGDFYSLAWVVEQCQAGYRDLRSREKRIIKAMLLGLCYHSDVTVREAVFGALYEIGDVTDYPLLIQGLKDKSWFVRSTAVEAFAKLCPSNAADDLETMLNDRHYIVRRNAALGLYDVVGEKCVPAVRRRLERERHINAKIGLLGVLARCGDSSGLSELMSLRGSLGTRENSLVDDILSNVGCAQVLVELPPHSTD